MTVAGCANCQGVAGEYLTAMQSADSPDEWFSLADQHLEAASILSHKTGLGKQVHLHSGFAVEFAIKGYLMRTRRLNQWPSRSDQPELYTHSIAKLAKAASVPTVGENDAHAASWALMLQWDRLQNYSPATMPDKVAISWYEAAGGKNGVVQWLKSL